ncbi:hypothetical protein G6O67_007952 [Ophiocordyceps sinensis]|uniref:Uncharacterized protein n=2 Tax=Ophiocordyceps sinensis TaxID=72228 RepID=A0A8H4PK13_9HYPO|nr:hypothetical protein OCS_05867 [Ophiocordyceps sinensis CO18]KAF4504506.1 hypothetical protein G6O67_007952 [Ophiocordyceps sinensis]
MPEANQSDVTLRRTRIRSSYEVLRNRKYYVDDVGQAPVRGVQGAARERRDEAYA